MASPQKEEGYVAIANEVYDVLNMIKLTQYQRDAIRLVIRLSYGCRQKSCQFKAWTDFEYCVGIHRTKIKGVLKSLEVARIFVINWEKKVIYLNKNYETWKVELAPTFRADRYAELIVRNIQGKSKLKAISQKLTVLANSYKLIANTMLAISYNHVSYWLIGAGVSVDNKEGDKPSGDAGSEAALAGAHAGVGSKITKRASKKEVGAPPPPSADNLPNADKEEGVGGQVRKLQQIVMDKYGTQIITRPTYPACRKALEEFDLEVLEEAAERAPVALDVQKPGVALNAIIGAARRAKEEADGGKDRGFGEDSRRRGQRSGKGGRKDKGGVDESRWAEIDRQLLGEDEGTENS